MQAVKKKHFERAAADFAAHGDNDTLPFDIDSRFIKAKQAELVDVAHRFSSELAQIDLKAALDKIESTSIFSERMLAPAGASGLRVVTKIHPFWTIYLNGLSIAIAEKLERTRSARASSYRYIAKGEGLFDRKASWRAFRSAASDEASNSDAVVVQTDISSFYERVYHHRLENRINDLFPSDPSVALQVDRILNRLASGRSFGLPVGGQAARILAEAFLAPIDQQLDELGLTWRRFVDDFVIVTPSHAEAYRAVCSLSSALADYGLTLNRTKTTFLTGKHFQDYVNTQIGSTGQEGDKLLEIDLHFDPYSDNPDAEFEELRNVVESLDIARLLNLELDKSQPDTFLVAQISRTLQLQKEPSLALQLCETLLSPRNLHAFRASWSTLMRGLTAVRSDESFHGIHDALDKLLDAVPKHSSHLLMAETSQLHYLRTLRCKRTPVRAAYLLKVYDAARSQTVKRACLDCWRLWKDRASFTRERNRWNALGPEEQRMLWHSAAQFGDEGAKFRTQVRRSIANSWALGIEDAGKPTFASIFASWKDT
jgi:hypothetical protein